MLGEFRLGREALDAGDLAEQLRRGERAAADQVEQFGRLRAEKLLKLAIQLVDTAGKLAAAKHELASDPRLDGLLQPREPPRDSVEPDTAIKRARRNTELRIEFVQVPAQTVLDSCPLGDQVGAVIVDQPHLALRAGQLRNRQSRISQRRPSNRERVDRVRLAPLTIGPARLTHQPRRHPYDPLAAAEQEALERTGHVPAVLERPQPLRTKTVRPCKQLLMASQPRRHRRSPSSTPVAPSTPTAV